MIVKKSSLLFKLANSYQPIRGNHIGLCELVRHATVVVLFLAVIAAVLFSVTCSMLYTPYVLMTNYEGLNEYTGVYESMLHIGIGAWVLAIFAAMLALIRWIQSVCKSALSGKPKAQTEPSIAMAYIKAKKDKVCPTVTLK